MVYKYTILEPSKRIRRRRKLVLNALSASALKAAILSASSLDDLKSLVDSASVERVMNADGTIRGVHYCAPSGKRGAVLQVAIRRNAPNGFTTSMVVDGKDFRTIYRSIIATVEGHYKIEAGSELSRKMHESVDAFLAKSGLRLIDVRYEQVVREN